MTAVRTDPTIGLVLVGVVVAVLVYERVQPDEPDPTTLDGLADLYAAGELSQAAYNRRRSVLLYDEEGIGPFSWLQEIDGVGPELAFAIAAEFETMNELRDAGRDDLEAVHGVGESTASAIQRRLRDEHAVYET